jgi:hypothetical protein
VSKEKKFIFESDDIEISELNSKVEKRKKKGKKKN